MENLVCDFQVKDLIGSKAPPGMNKTLHHSLVEWQKDQQAIQNVKEFKSKLLEITSNSLVAAEVLMIINQRPANLNFLLPLIEDAEQRFNESQLNNILDLVQSYLKNQEQKVAA